MTAIGALKPEPSLAQLTKQSPAAEVRHTAIPPERSLVEILSLTDARRFVPEALGLLLLIVLAQSWLHYGSAGAGSMPHPFWIPVLAMSGQYEIMGGLFATVAATATYFVGGLPDQSAAQDFYDYTAIIMAQPCAWFGTALVLGGLRTLHIHHHADLQARFEQVSVIAEDLANGLENSVEEVERLEQRIATDHSTLTGLLHSLAKLDLADRQSLLSSMADAIRLGVGATSFAVYLSTPCGFEPCIGVVDGAVVGTAAIPSLPPELRPDGIREAAAARPEPANTADHTCLPLSAPIAKGNGQPDGLVVCSRLHPSQKPAIAQRRLNEISRILATLLPACPARTSQAQ